MTVIRVKGLGELGRVLGKDLRERDRRVRAAARRTAQKGAAVVRRNAPVAFSNLRDSVHAEGARIVVDAPHAAAVEKGSRPHFPPLEPIIKWVKLRGAQGLTGKGGRGPSKRLTGSTTGRHASGVRTLLDLSVSKNLSTDVDAPRKIALMIARAIAAHGTKPQLFVLKSMPEVEAILDREIRAALDKE